MNLRRFNYCPAIRTRNAELRGYKHLPKKTANALLPIIELSRSRRSKNNPIGSIARSIDYVLDTIGERPYIADLTTLKRLQNPEITGLLDPRDGFSSWTQFVAERLPKPCIPNVHLTLPFQHDNFMRQVAVLAEKHEYLALRIPTSYEEYPSILQALTSSADVCPQFLLFFDCGYVEPFVTKGAIARLREMVNACSELSIAACAPLASSFPNSVVAPGYGEDSYGKFLLSEVLIHEALTKELHETRLLYGDYASIHPLDFEGTVTNWVPRVDCPLKRELYYYRYRREDGGYVRAAKAVSDDSDYKPIDCWGFDNIEEAADGRPRGNNPAHWIAVRLNIHICKQLSRVSS